MIGGEIMESQMNMDSLVTYCSESNSVNCNGTTFDYDWYTYPVIREYYPNYYYSYPIYQDNYKKAFNIAKLLLKKDLLVSRKLKDFIGLVEEIAKEL